MGKTKGTDERSFEVFIPGEVVDLCVPSREPWVIDQWYRWFNDPSVTHYLIQGIYPNTPEKQEDYYRGVQAAGDRIILLIKPKAKDFFVGVVSLSDINYVQRQCDIALVIGHQDHSTDSIFYALEAKCRMTEHAFENVGVERINSGQAIELIKWQRWQIVFGYQIEGILRKKLRRGNKVWDVMASSCLLKDYMKLKELRGGSLWPGKKALLNILRTLPEETVIDRLGKFFDHERQLMWKYIINQEHCK